MGDLFLLSEAQMRRIERYFPHTPAGVRIRARHPAERMTRTVGSDVGGAPLALRSGRHMGETPPAFQLTATEPGAEAPPRLSGRSPLQCATNVLQKARWADE